MSLPSITTRATKGSALTYTEMDSNFQNLANVAVPITVIDKTGATAGTVATTAAAGYTLQAASGGAVNLAVAGNVITVSSTGGGGGSDTFNNGTLTGTGPVQISADVLVLDGQSVILGSNQQGNAIIATTSALADSGITTGAAAIMVSQDPALVVPGGTVAAVVVPDTSSTFQSNVTNLGFNITQQQGWGNVYIPVTNGTTSTYYQFSNVGLRFADSTVQSTAGLARTGGSVTGNVEFNNNYISNAILATTTEKVANIGVVLGAVTVNANTGPIQTAVVSGNITINTTNMTNFNTGESVTLVLTQATNANTRILTSNLKYAGATKTLSTANAAIDTISITYDGVNYLASLVKGYA